MKPTDQLGTYGDILNVVSEKYGLPPEQVNTIWKSQFDFIKHKVETEVNPETGHVPMFLLQKFIVLKTNWRRKKDIKIMAEKVKARKLKKLDESTGIKYNNESGDCTSFSLPTGTHKEDLG